MFSLLFNVLIKYLTLFNILNQAMHNTFVEVWLLFVVFFLICFIGPNIQGHTELDNLRQQTELASKCSKLNIHTDIPVTESC